MPTACVLQTGAHVRLSGQRLIVTCPSPEEGEPAPAVREIPLRDIERFIHGEDVEMTSPAVAALMRANIPVTLLGTDGRCLGSFLPPSNAHARFRLLQYQRTLDAGFTRDISRRLITAKLYNQRRVLQRLAANREEPRHNVAAAVQWLESGFASLRVAASVEEIRGHEGATTARYFSAWAQFLPEPFPFERRSTRPPLNPVNACISFGATVIYSEMVAFIQAHGLDPAMGCLHTVDDRRWSLALDLIEPFRPAFVEALTVDLFSHQILNQTHFEARDGGTYLNAPGRRKFFMQYERRLERQFLCEALGHRTTLRQQLEQQAVLFKSALEDPSTYEPFVMN